MSDSDSPGGYNSHNFRRDSPLLKAHQLLQAQPLLGTLTQPAAHATMAGIACSDTAPTCPRPDFIFPERERESMSVCVRERECVCLCVCVCGRERE